MVRRLKGISGRLDRLAASVDERFQQVERRFEHVDERFEQIDRRFEHVDERFEQIDRRFEQIDRRFEQVDRRFDEVDSKFAALERLILNESEKTRRHFDVTAERIRDERNLSIDRANATDERIAQLRVANAFAHAVFDRRLDECDRRLSSLEDPERRHRT